MIESTSTHERYITTKLPSATLYLFVILVIGDMNFSRVVASIIPSLYVISPSSFLLYFNIIQSTVAMSTIASPKIIDSHLHVWANSEESTVGGFPYAEGQDPPESLKDAASTAALLKQMDSNKVAGSLIVQPINHKFDHSYVTNAIENYPDRFKGILLHDPSLSREDAITRLEDLTLKGYVGVRFNPYLWPRVGEDSWTPMSTPGGAGEAVYKRCAELHMPVGIMCFQGLQLHYDDILRLLKSSPSTICVLDHFGFTKFTEEGNRAFEQLLKLAEYPQVIVKISALFRLADVSPYERVKKERFEPLLQAFGKERLMFGTDFPFVLEQEPERYAGMIQLVSSWMANEATLEAVMGGTAERVFGPWGST
jgi:predicted TIM-barrel fold metal-dependent hydrolase